MFFSSEMFHEFCLSSSGCRPGRILNVPPPHAQSQDFLKISLMNLYFFAHLYQKCLPYKFLSTKNFTLTIFYPKLSSHYFLMFLFLKLASHRLWRANFTAPHKSAARGRPPPRPLATPLLSSTELHVISFFNNILLQNEEVCGNTIYSSSEASGVNHIIHRSPC